MTGKIYLLNALVTRPEITLNRVSIFLEKHDYAVALSLKSRIPEGQVLSLEEMEKIGYELVLIHRVY